MTTRAHRPIKVVALNVNCIGRQRYELSRQLQNHHIDVTSFSEKHLKPHENFFIPNFHIHQTDSFPGLKYGLSLWLEKVSLINM